VKRLLTAYLGTLAVVSVIAWSVIAALGPPGDLGPVAAAVILPIAAAVALFFIYLMIGIGVFVYQDSKNRGMEPVLWVIVAVLVPYFIGLIAYLLIRHPVQVTCPSCGHRASSDASFCPRCGKELKFLCTQCRQPMVSGSKFCPSCGTQIANEKDD
jgi:hypothetical protein